VIAGHGSLRRRGCRIVELQDERDLARELRRAGLQEASGARVGVAAGRALARQCGTIVRSRIERLGARAGCNAYAAPLASWRPARRSSRRDPAHPKLKTPTASPAQRPVPGDHRRRRRCAPPRCSAIGFTIYPRLGGAHEMYGQIRELAHEAKRKGLAVSIWSYPRAGHLQGARRRSTWSPTRRRSPASWAARRQGEAADGAHRAARRRRSTRRSASRSRPRPSACATWCRRFNGRRIGSFRAARRRTRPPSSRRCAPSATAAASSIIGRTPSSRPRSEALDFLRQVMDI